MNYYLSICFLEEAENMVPGFLLWYVPTLVSLWELGGKARELYVYVWA